MIQEFDSKTTLEDICEWYNLHHPKKGLMKDVKIREIEMGSGTTERGSGV